MYNLYAQKKLCLRDSNPFLPLGIIQHSFWNSQFLLTRSGRPFSCHSDEKGSYCLLFSSIALFPARVSCLWIWPWSDSPGFDHRENPVITRKKATVSTKQYTDSIRKMGQKLLHKFNYTIAGIGTSASKPVLKKFFCLCTKGWDRMIWRSSTFMRIISHRYALLITVNCFYCGININHNTRQSPNHAAAEPKRPVPDTDPNSVNKSFHLIDVLLRKKYAKSGRSSFHPESFANLPHGTKHGHSKPSRPNVSNVRHQ